jgi:signal transduction histidine kinase
MAAPDGVAGLPPGRLAGDGPSGAPPGDSPGGARAYLLAVAASAAAWALSRLLERWVDAGDVPLFLGAVMLGAWAGGMGPGLLATLAGVVAGLTSTGAPAAGLAVGPAVLARLGIFTLEALVIASLAAALRKAQLRAEDLARGMAGARTEVEATAVRLRDLQRVTDTALAHLHLEALLRELLGRIRDSLAADTVVILLLDDDGKELDVRAALGLEEEVRQRIRIPLGRGVAGRIAAEGRLMVFDDLDRVEIWSPVLRDKRLAALLGAPLRIEGHVLGVVHVGTMAPRRFTVDDAELLQRVADRIAVAIDRARLLDRVIAVQEDERRRLSRDLHDETGQSLTSLLVGLRAVGEAPTLEAARDQAAVLRQIATRTLDEVRRVARGLRPRVLDELGLVAAVEQHAAEYGQAHGMAVDVKARGLGPGRLPPAVETTLYRIVQEGLTNAATHGQARSVAVVLQRAADGVHVMISDDGLGFDPAALSGAGAARAPLGLRGMKERATLLGGAVTVESAPGEGTTVDVRLPLGRSSP